MPKEEVQKVNGVAEEEDEEEYNKLIPGDPDKVLEEIKAEAKEGSAIAKRLLIIFSRWDQEEGSAIAKRLLIISSRWDQEPVAPDSVNL